MKNILKVGAQMYKKRFIHKLILTTIFISMAVYAQRPQDGHINHRKYGVMDGNLTRIPYWNDGRIGRNLGIMGYVMEYPIGSGHQQMDGVGPVIVTKIVDVHGQTHACCETAYDTGDLAPDGSTRWRYEALGGYCNPSQLEAAMSDDPYTWPDYWPDKMDDSIDPGWPGAWNGYFGKGVMNADLETYFVIDDDPDEEFDYYPDANDSTRRGLGTQIYIRSLQWRNIMTETHNFWLYDVENEGTTTYDSVYFALFADFKIGGDDDDVAGYNTRLDVAYCYDYKNVGKPGNYSPVPVCCYGFLESPTLGYDGIDSDEDGLIDERRDSGPGTWVYGPTGYYYNGKLDEQKQRLQTGEYFSCWHWSGDEDGDWRGYEDLNGNGQWDEGEPLNDDLGADGIGSFDEAYTGRDYGEGDGRPTLGEPNFDALDLDEGDQMGLTGFWSGNHGDRSSHSDDELVLKWCYQLVGFGADEYHFSDNLGVWFHSGPAYFPAKTRNNFSFTLFFADGKTSKEQLEDAIRKKDTVQKIYNANYNFAKPPKVPILKAVAGDRKVYLYWDDSAEKSFDRFFGVYDFQGYSLYRSTDPSFTDPHIITDGYGSAIMNKPIFRCDKKDSIYGFFPGTYNGVHFYLGDNSGLVHSYIDSSNIINGQTYYYALCSFDNGWIPPIPAEGVTERYIHSVLYESVLPTECSFDIKIDMLNDVKSHSPNCAIVTPKAPAAGYVAPDIGGSVVHYGPQSNARIRYEIFNPLELVDGRYRLEFSYPDSGWRSMPWYRIVRRNEGGEGEDEVQPLRQCERLDEETVYFDGLIVKIKFDTSHAILSNGWRGGSVCRLPAVISAEPSLEELAVNLDFDIVFTEGISDTAFRTSRYSKIIPVPFYIYCPNLGERLRFAVVDNNNNGKWEVTEPIRLVFGWKRGKKPAMGYRNFWYSWRVEFTPPADAKEVVGPVAGDVFEVRMHVPPLEGEVYEFSSEKARFDVGKAKSELDRIAVVPNPYIVTELWEPSSPYLAGRGPMAIHFIHLPPRCTIRIYTVQGYLVDTIEHESELNDGMAVWDVMSKDNMHIAPGNYIYHVQAPNVGNKIGRFVVIK